MKQERFITIAAILLLLSIVMAGHFLMQQNLASEEYTARMELLQRANQLNTQLDRDVQRILTLRPHHYDSVVETVSQIRANRKLIGSTDVGLRGIIDKRFDSQIDQFLESSQLKSEILERIKLEAALLRNSLQYLPGLIDELHTETKFSTSDFGTHLLGAFLNYNLFPSSDHQQRLEQLIKDLKVPVWTESLHKLRSSILLHLTANIKHREQISSLIIDYDQLPSSQLLAQVRSRYESFYKSQSEHFYTISQILIVLVLSLIAGLTYTLYQIRIARAASDSANRQLHDALESISEAFVLFDDDNRLVLWNRQYAELFGESADLLQLGVSQTELAEHYLERGDYAANSSMLNDLLLNSSSEVGGSEILVNNCHYLVNSSTISTGGIASVYVDITERIEMERKLYGLSQAVEQSPASILVTDTKGNIEYVNPKFVELTGYSEEEIIGQNPRILKSGKTSSEEYKQMWKTIDSGGEWRGEFLNKHKNGDLYWEFASISGIRDKNGEITNYLAVKEDITERKQVEEQLRIAAAVFNTSNEGIVVTNADNQIMAVNPSFTKITGYRSEEVIGKNPNLLNSGQHGPEFYNEMWVQLQEKGYWEGEIWNRSKSGEVYPEWLSLSVIKDDEGNVIEHIAIFSDITQRKNAEEKIRWQANYDAITGLPNRTLFRDRLSSAISNAHREGWTSALLFIDLDHFKIVNDTLGHAVGDDLLKSGVAIFAKVCFGHPSPSKQQNLTRPFMPTAPRPSCVRRVITSSRLYTTPSVTLRRHKAAAASSSSSARALNYEYADGVDYRGLTAFASLSMAVSAGRRAFNRLRTRGGYRCATRR
ncbi:PAS domain S-box protein [Candidatus Reidiella endopervernicosa]|uniref:PAS domain S-box protein n=1 Tax=Candidatus Reidiella endopervernicosa TaxID=2738883 RepID=A0A6N0HXE4_9GAMM|nr:PAS domain S-box protein [Candidatus Reidiella endopervernicosa]QKQ26951.1 PAS domain S-box protein [Candidatus Reidiella endopervernicosa]